MSVTFHTTGNLRYASIINKSTELTYNPAVNVIDRNPISYWSPDYASESSPYVTVDFGSALQVDNLFLLIRNYDVECFDAGNAYPILQHSTNNSTWTTWWNPMFSSDSFTAAGNPIWGADFTTTPLTSQTKRYWRFVISGYTYPVFIAGLYLVRSYSITQAPGITASKSIIPSVTVTGGSGTLFVRPIRATSSETQTWNFILGQTDRDNFRAIFNDCHGTEWPFIYQETTNVNDMRLLRFASDELKEHRVAQSVYEISVDVCDVAIHRSGETF